MDISAIKPTPQIIQHILNLTVQTSVHGGKFFKSLSSVEELGSLIEFAMKCRNPKIKDALDEFHQQLQKEQELFFLDLGIDFSVLVKS